MKGIYYAEADILTDRDDNTMMAIGILYFLVIVAANTVGAISGMGGGVIIKPVFDSIGAHSVATISFYSSTAVLVMSFVSTVRQMQEGVHFRGRVILFIAIGALLGGMLGNLTLDGLLQAMQQEEQVQLLQIFLLVVTLLFALFYTRCKWQCLELSGGFWFVVCGMVLGFFASLLGIGGGPINVALLMFWFGFPIKRATMYSITIIFLSQSAKMLTLAATTGFQRFDLTMLLFVVPAGAVGGFLGAYANRIFSPARVEQIFQVVIMLVLLLNAYNFWSIVG